MKNLLIFILIGALYGLVFAPVYAVEAVCTAYPLKLITTALTEGAGNVKVTHLQAHAHGCAHEYTPSAADLKKIQNGNIILIANGVGLDDHIVKQAKQLNPKLKIIYANAADKSPAPVDAHTFASPDTAEIMAKNITAGLIAADSANQQLYAANQQKFCGKMQELTRQLQALSSNQTVFIHYPVYKNLCTLLKWQVLTLKQEKSELPPPGRLIELVKQGKKSRPAARLILCDSTADPAVQQLAKAAQATLLQIDPLLHGEDDAPANRFIETMTRNVEQIKKALNK